ncbi:hypothetical protein LEP1GSC047_3905 [Leptospira inadai serovar Lyme str. 10]|uniref:Uncharacterized protein n=1 Tax=Leptospira inadai serovar Lyme str. 10 TaxID=1049790 RepID=V6HDD2_9LEPT|nr:hypothetical protein LEP1GSC047_3905 [Leptospira inadai serovar Lyme str. 10]
MDGMSQWVVGTMTTTPYHKIIYSKIIIMDRLRKNGPES